MFSTCLICHRSLGANEIVETFPVGRRLAFDERTGRLWAVCQKCGHWNLSPIEERWEAIETCERLYRQSRIKAATDNIGLTTLKEGLDLVRIGKPLRPEFSAWRYGPRIVKRQRKAALVAIGTVAVGAAAGIALVGGSIAVAALIVATGKGGALIGAGITALDKANDYRSYERVVASLPGESRVPFTIRQKHLQLASIEHDDSEAGWRLSIHHERGHSSLHGIHATLAAGRLLAHLNKKGASKKVVADAANTISEAGDAQQLIRNSIALREKRRRNGDIMRDKSIGPFGLRYEERLAIEMAMHEDSERIALQGELAALEEAWKTAEEIGSISDKLFDKK